MIPATLPRSGPLPPPAEKPAPPRETGKDDTTFSDLLPAEKPMAETPPAAGPGAPEKERAASPGKTPEERGPASPAPPATTGAAPGGRASAVDALTLTLLHGAPAAGAENPGATSPEAIAPPAPEPANAKLIATAGGAPVADPALAPPKPGLALETALETSPVPGALAGPGNETVTPTAAGPTPASAESDRRRGTGRKGTSDTEGEQLSITPPASPAAAPLPAATAPLSAVAGTGPGADADGAGEAPLIDGTLTTAASSAPAGRLSPGESHPDRAAAATTGTSSAVPHPASRPDAAAPLGPSLPPPDGLAALAPPSPGAAPGGSGASSSAPAPMPVISAQPGRLGPELGVAIARHVAAGDARGADILTLRLDPPNHGRIEVHLTFEDGAPLRATVMASHSSTLELLRRDSGDLARALAQAGIGTDDGSFRFAQGDGGQQAQNGFQRPSPPQSAAEPDAGDASDSLLPLPDLAYRRLRASGTIDLIT